MLIEMHTDQVHFLRTVCGSSHFIVPKTLLSWQILREAHAPHPLTNPDPSVYHFLISTNVFH
jgi:hypothetical protein